ncbi:MAG: OmpA family protein [Prevotellaceae bacterium]|jgi:chemotaxis protein MotB|nr:OmpA family protein [Prevotellaceae bacterium]
MKRISILIVSCLLAFTSCVTSKKYKELESSYNKLKNNYENLNVKSNEQTGKLKQLTDEIAKLNSEADALREQSRTMKKQYEDLQTVQKNLSTTSQKEMQELLRKIQQSEESLQQKEDELREKNKRYMELQAAMEKQAEALTMLKQKVADALVGFEGKGLSVVQKNGKVYVSVDEKLLFKSGKWDIEKPGLEALAEVSKILEQNTDINIVVEGHTDNVKYSGTGALIDNWDLSVKRATTVVRTLLKNTTIDPKRITAAGRGEFVPLDTNETNEGKQKNRRTEIILTPKFDELLDILNN